LTFAVALSLVGSAFGQTPVKRSPQSEPPRAPLAKKPTANTPTKQAPQPNVTAPVAPVASTSTVTFGKVSDRAIALADEAASQAIASLGVGPRYVPVTITSRSGARAGRVVPGDIGIVEDGVRMRVTSLERWPLWLVIVLDVGRQVGPMKQLAAHRQLVYDLIGAIGEDDHIALVQYADGVELIQPFTLDPREAERSLEAKFESGLDGQFWDSVAYASTDLLADKVGTRTVVVITDGVDDTSQSIAFGRALEKLRRSSTTLHVVNLSRYLDEQIKKQAYGVNGVLNVIQSPSYIGRRKELRSYRDKLDETPAQMEKATVETGGKLWMASPQEDLATLPIRIWEQIDGQFMAACVPDRPEEKASAKPIHAYSVFVRRADIDARVPPNLLVPIIPFRANGGAVLRKRN